MEYNPPDPTSIRYDPAYVSLAGSVSSALLMCWYEHIFAQAGWPESIERPDVDGWRKGIGYGIGDTLHWFPIFYRIGTFHVGKNAYETARVAQRVFLCPKKHRYLYYAIEVKDLGGPAVLHRNRTLIESKLRELLGLTPKEVHTMATGPYTEARFAAHSIIEEMERAVEKAEQGKTQ